MNVTNFPNLQDSPFEREPQTLRGMTDDRSQKRNYIDLRHLVDDKTVLKNPHKGWFWHYVDQGLIRNNNYRGEHDINDGLSDFPGLNHLYLRFDWSDIEKEKGVYDFSPLEDIMELWGARGYRFSMRVCTFETGTGIGASPAYVFEEGAKCYSCRGGQVIEPDYGDPIFLCYLEKFMQAWSAKYNDDKRIECIDVGTIGTWGEGHTENGTQHIYPLDVVKRHIDLHCKYFPDTPILCNDDHVAGRFGRGIGEVMDMLEYVESRSIGVQDDSVCCDGYTEDCDYDSMRAPWMFDRIYKNAPTAIESQHYTSCLKTPHYYRDGLTLMESLKRSHATYAGFHGYPRPWLEKHKYIAEYCANRLGYWYFITAATVPSLMTATAYNKVELEMENRGWAPAYNSYALKFKLTGEDGDEYVVNTDFDNRSLMPSQPQSVSLRLDLRGVPAGKYNLSVGLFENATPILLALKNHIYHNGFYKIATVSVKVV
ncbi:MAG: DUF4832 domain-containing protein [Clostridia bacterium]|nr:DUF4832 domain-containing protein [Clostridia bacterium]